VLLQLSIVAGPMSVVACKRTFSVRRGFRRCHIADADVFANVRFAPTAEVSYDAITIPDLDLLSAIAAGDREIAPRIGFSLTSNSALPEE
jgi:hypothetical protein